MMLFESIIRSVLDGSLAAGRPLISSERIEWAERALQYYESPLRQEEHLTTVFSHLFAKPEKWKAFPKTTYALTKGVVDTLCTLYQDPVQRTWDGEEKLGKKAEELWAEVEGFDDLMQSIDEETLLVGTEAAKPFVGEDGKMDFSVYPSHQIEILPDPKNPTIAREVMLAWRSVEQGKSTITRHFWNDKEFIETVDDTRTSESGPHEYREIPLGWFRNRRPRRKFYDEPAIDLIKANLMINFLMTMINNTVGFQTFSTLVTKGAPSDFAPVVGFSSWFDVGRDGDAFFLTPGTNIPQAIEAVNLNLGLFFASRRVPESAITVRSTSGSEGRSGVALVEDKAALRDYRKQRINAMRPLETRLICLALKVLHFHKTGQVVDFPAPKIDYTELQEPMSQEERELWEWEIERDAATMVDYVMQKQGIEDEQKALEVLRENVKRNLEFKKKVSPFQSEGADEGADGGQFDELLDGVTQ